MAFSLEIRRKIFNKAGGRCERCNKQLVFNNHNKGERGAWHAHHKTSLASDGKDIASNGKALCLDCHKSTRTYGKKISSE